MNIADTPGLYKNFSGQIKFHLSNCVVRNADFELLEKYDKNSKEIIFADAVFVSGKVHWSIIKNALNLGCNFFRCRIDYMINKGGEIFCCRWHDGIFEGGLFSYSAWRDGIWIKGAWDRSENSKGEETELPPDQWRK